MPISHSVRHLVLSIFIACHLIALPLDQLPMSEWRDYLLAPFVPYINFWGLEQNWAVFAPTPPQWNRYLTARIEFDDGSSTIWEFPRMEKMGLVDKMFNERFRKWANDYVADPQQAFIWPDTVRYIARLHAHGRKQPVSVSIIRHETPIFLPDRSPSDKREAITDVIFTQNILPGDLH